MASARRAVLFAVSDGGAAQPLHPAMPPAAVVGGAQEAPAMRELEMPGAGAVLAPATSSRVGGAQEALVARELPVVGAVLAPATASRSRDGGAQQALVVPELAVPGAGAVAKKRSPQLSVAGDDDRRRASSVDSVLVGRAPGSAAPPPPAPNSLSRPPFPPSKQAPDDLALHRTMAEGDGARAPLAPGLIVGIFCCYCARKRRAAAREQVLRSPASPRWVSPDDLVQV